MTTDWTCDEHVRVCERLTECETIASITARTAAALEARLHRVELRVSAWAAGGAIAGAVMVAVATQLIRMWIGG